MNNLPAVLILGRPNVGKSTLINRLIRKKKAITLDIPGVTRDISYHPIIWNEKHFFIMDSGGIYGNSSYKNPLQRKVSEKVLKAAQEASQIIFLTDYQSGVHPLDEALARQLRRYKEKIILAVNKVDSPKEVYVQDFFKLGFGEPYPISSLQGSGLDALLNQITSSFTKGKDMPSHLYKIALVGRPNVGKSSLVNALIQDDHMIVDSEAGTTRDAVEMFFNHQGKRFCFTDTAGIRQKAKTADGVEYFSLVRTQQAILESHLTIVVLDSMDFLRDQDKKIINLVQKYKRNMILFINKWDLTDRTNALRDHFIRYAFQELPFLEYYPFVFGSAKESHNVGSLFKVIPKVISTSEKRLGTPALNRFIDMMMRANPPSTRSGVPAKIFYGTQIDIQPPVFIFFMNRPDQVRPEYIRALEKRLREYAGGFYGSPIQIYFRGRQATKKT